VVSRQGGQGVYYLRAENQMKIFKKKRRRRTPKFILFEGENEEKIECFISKMKIDAQQSQK
jgi:hypothetical protein